MAETNKLVTLIALLIIGVLLIAWGAIYIWLFRNDRLVIADLQRRGSITVADAARLTNPTWIWILAIAQMVIGAVLVIWGLFQYFAKVEDVVLLATKGNKTVATAVPAGTTVVTTNGNGIVGASSPIIKNGGASRRVFSCASSPVDV